MFHSSYIELSKSALENNLRFLRKTIGPQVRYSSVIKGNAYGHSIEHFLPLAEECGIRHFAVFDAFEALKGTRVRMHEDTDFMIMGMIDNDELSWAIEEEISFYVFELDRLAKAAEIARAQKKKARIHIELETGMNRTGFEPAELEEVVRIIHENSEHLKIEGICTHYAGAESTSNYFRITNQREEFRKLSGWLREQGIVPEYHHTACSAAALTIPETIMDMTRIGIAQYGFWPSQETYMSRLKLNGGVMDDPLHRVITWKSHVMSMKYLEPGEYVNYGNIYLTSRHQKAAAVPIGYAHGFARQLSNRGMVLIRGQRAPVMGVVNMNMMMVDVTDIDHVEKGDEVTIIGGEGENSISVASFSDMSDYLNYEALIRIPSNIPRFVVE